MRMSAISCCCSLLAAAETAGVPTARAASANAKDGPKMVFAIEFTAETAAAAGKKCPRISRRAPRARRSTSFFTGCQRSARVSLGQAEALLCETPGVAVRVGFDRVFQRLARPIALSEALQRYPFLVVRLGQCVSVRVIANRHVVRFDGFLVLAVLEVRIADPNLRVVCHVGLGEAPDVRLEPLNRQIPLALRVVGVRHVPQALRRRAD